jgi:hypothetical protein
MRRKKNAILQSNKRILSLQEFVENYKSTDSF